MSPLRSGPCVGGPLDGGMLHHNSSVYRTAFDDKTGQPDAPRRGAKRGILFGNYLYMDAMELWFWDKTSITDKYA